MLGINAGDYHKLVKVRVQQLSPFCYYLVSFRSDGNETLATMLWAGCRQMRAGRADDLPWFDTQNRWAQTALRGRRLHLYRRMYVAIGKEPVGRISDGFLERPESDTQFADRLRCRDFMPAVHRL